MLDAMRRDESKGISLNLICKTRGVGIALRLELCMQNSQNKWCSSIFL